MQTSPPSQVQSSHTCTLTRLSLSFPPPRRFIWLTQQLKVEGISLAASQSLFRDTNNPLMIRPELVKNYLFPFCSHTHMCSRETSSLRGAQQWMRGKMRLGHTLTPHSTSADQNVISADASHFDLRRCVPCDGIVVCFQYWRM